jgi:hypothetical protein
MTTKITKESLAAWIEDIKEAAEDDNCFSVAFFKDTENSPFSIIAGWVRGISESYADLFYMSKSEPGYAMCVKIAINDGQHCPDFETMNMPTDKFGNVDDTCIALEQGEDAESLATFLLCEWERIMEEHGKEVC